jgi:DNA-binding MarR family transcriptional regulator
VAVKPEQRFEGELAAAWPAFMGVLLEQRMRWSEVAAELHLAPGALRALLAVDPDRPRPMSELARELDCDRSYVTGIVDDLERAGYAERRPDPADRRIRTVALTATGRRALGVVRDRLMSPPPELAILTPAQQRALAGLLRRAVPQ